MDTNRLSEKIVRKCQEEELKPSYKKKYKPRTTLQTVKRRKACKGRRRYESEDIAEKSAKATEALNGSYAYDDTANITMNDDAKLERIVIQTISEWAIEEGLEVIIK